MLLNFEVYDKQTTADDPILNELDGKAVTVLQNDSGPESNPVSQQNDNNSPKKPVERRQKLGDILRSGHLYINGFYLGDNTEMLMEMEGKNQDSFNEGRISQLLRTLSDDPATLSFLFYNLNHSDDNGFLASGYQNFKKHYKDHIPLIIPYSLHLERVDELGVKVRVIYTAETVIVKNEEVSKKDPILLFDTCYVISPDTEKTVKISVIHNYIGHDIMALKDVTFSKDGKYKDPMVHDIVEVENDPELTIFTRDFNRLHGSLHIDGKIIDEKTANKHVKLLQYIRESKNISEVNKQFICQKLDQNVFTFHPVKEARALFAEHEAHPTCQCKSIEFISVPEDPEALLCKINFDINEFVFFNDPFTKIKSENETFLTTTETFLIYPRVKNSPYRKADDTEGQKHLVDIIVVDRQSDLKDKAILKHIPSLANLSTLPVKKINKKPANLAIAGGATISTLAGGTILGLILFPPAGIIAGIATSIIGLTGGFTLGGYGIFKRIKVKKAIAEDEKKQIASIPQFPNQKSSTETYKLINRDFNDQDMSGSINPESSVSDSYVNEKPSSYDGLSRDPSMEYLLTNESEVENQTKTSLKSYSTVSTLFNVSEKLKKDKSDDEVNQSSTPKSPGLKKGDD